MTDFIEENVTMNTSDKYINFLKIYFEPLKDFNIYIHVPEEILLCVCVDKLTKINMKGIIIVLILSHILHGH